MISILEESNCTAPSFVGGNLEVRHSEGPRLLQRAEESSANQFSRFFNPANTSRSCYNFHAPEPSNFSMDFDQLETFLEVARLNSFSRAAERRFRTQPAISSQIRSLEEEVGAKLLDRSGGKVSVTASGKLFQKFAEQTVAARKAMLTGIAETERVPRGEIVVGANEGTCLHILPEVFAEFKKQHPNVSVNIKRADYAKILESVVDNS